MTTAAKLARRPLLALASAALYALSFPPVDVGLVTGWCALVPLAFAVRGLPARKAAALGAVFGFAVAQLVFGWLYRFDAFHLGHGALLAAYVALYPAMFAVYLARWGEERRGLFLVPVAGAVIEWLRAHAGFLALPWATFAQTQHRDVPLVQLAALGGEPLVGMVVVAVNVAIFQLLLRLPRRAPLTVAGACVLVHVGGSARLLRADVGSAVVVSAVQPAIAVGERSGGDAEASLARLAALSKVAKESGTELVVWPESAVGLLEGDLETKLAVRDVVEAIQAPIVFGSSHVEKLGRSETSTAHARPTNAAFSMVPGQPVAAPYKKVRLLPFGEYRPIDLPEWLAPRMFDTERGDSHTPLVAGAFTVETVICWENLFAEEVHASGSEAPSLIAHLVNDAWFGPTAQPALHNLVSVFRAVEAHRPVIVASNMGPSQIIDARGRIVARTTKFFAPDVITATIHTPGGKTLYRRFGDWTWATASALVLLVARLRRVRAAG